MKKITCAIVTVLTLLLWAKAGAGDDEGSKTARTRNTALYMPGAVLSKSDVQVSSDRHSSDPIHIASGVVLPAKGFKFSKRSKDHSFTLGGMDFTIANTGSKDYALKVGKKGVPLKQHDKGLTPVPVPLKDRRKYVIAFPYARLYSTSGTIYARSGCAEKGRVGRQEILIYDDNFDGVYSKDDTFTLDKRGLVFAPIAENIGTEKGIVKIEDVKENGEITYSEPEMKTGEISLKYLSRGLEAHLAFSSEDGKVVTVLTSKDRSAEVLPGKYKLLYGVIFEARKKRVVAGVLPGEMDIPEVKEGEKVELEMGGPWKAAFSVSKRGRKISISPSSIKLTGKAGEKYVGFEISTAPKVYVNDRPNGSFEFG